MSTHSKQVQIQEVHPPNHPLTPGICSLSSAAENSYLVFPHPSSASPTFHPSHAPSTPSPLQHTGEVLIFDTLSLSPINIISAHKTPIALLSLSPKGDILATASDKGTVIRVFSVLSGDKLFQFRRGSYPAKITSMAFSHHSDFLVVGSDTETVHLFRCNTSKPGSAGRPGSEANGGGGWCGPSSPTDGTGDGEDMDRVIEAKRRNGSMGYTLPVKFANVVPSSGKDPNPSQNNLPPPSHPYFQHP